MNFTTVYDSNNDQIRRFVNLFPREKLVKPIRTRATSICIFLASVTEIDEINSMGLH